MFGCAGSALLQAVFLVVGSGGCSLATVLGLLLFSAHGLSCPSAWGIFPDQRDQNHVPHVGGRILNQWNTAEVPLFSSFFRNCSNLLSTGSFY